ncbi:MAG: COG4315 family predicted lipoprotein [Scandinavium sp.]|uniref:COG4315 family predicted lipoprotein n=1 Tax=Scandinavium sp. TaxID=2830653 RepID=UPI003F339C68
MKKITLAALLTFSAFSIHAAEVTTRSTPLGEIYTNSEGMTLYTFDKDRENLSVCYDDCAKRWPPIVINANTKLMPPFGSAPRRDGKLQLTWNKMPLYLWYKDKAPGETTGDGVNGVWHIVPAGK